GFFYQQYPFVAIYYLFETSLRLLQFETRNSYLDSLYLNNLEYINSFLIELHSNDGLHFSRNSHSLFSLLPPLIYCAFCYPQLLFQEVCKLFEISLRLLSFEQHSNHLALRN